MSSIDPSSGPTGPSAPAGPTAPTSGTGAAGPVDTITSSNPTRPTYFSTSNSATPWLVPPDGDMSLLKYANLIGTARINLTTQTSYSDQMGFTVTKNMWANAIGVAEMIRSFYQNLRTIHANTDQLAATQQAHASLLTPVIDDYNLQNDFAGDQAATDAMNLAIGQFNSGSITETQFNDAVNTYNSYADAHNLLPYVIDYNAQATLYNAQVDAFNDTVQATNLLNASLGLPLLPEEEYLPTGILPPASLAPPATPPVALLPTLPTSIPSADPAIADSSFNSLVEQSGFEDYVNDLLDSVNQTNDLLFNADNFRDLNVFTHRNLLDPQNPPYLNESYIQKDRQGSSPPSSGQGAAVGGGYTTLSTGLHSNALSSTLGLGNYIASAQDTNAAIFLEKLVATANLSVGRTAGLLSASPAVLSVGESSLGGLSAGSAAVDVLAALGFSNVIRGLINSRALTGLVGNLLATNGVSEKDLAVLTRSVTAGFQLSLIQQSIFQVAKALGLPGSVAQVLGNISGIPRLDSVLRSAATPTVNDLIANQHQANFLKNNLITQLSLSHPELDQGQAAQIVSDAIDRAIAQGDYASTAAFSSALQDQLIQQGLDEDSAIASSVQASALIDDELYNDSLDQSVTDDSIQESILESDSITQQAIESSIQSSQLVKETQTVRDIRDGVLKELTLQGAVFQDALKRANQLAEAITGKHLAEAISAQTLDESALQKSLQENLARTGHPALAGTITEAILASGFKSAAEIHLGVFAQLKAAGIADADAHAIADRAVVIKKDADAFLSVGGGSILSLSEVSGRLQAEAYAILNKSFDNPTAMSVARQLAMAIVGAPSNQDISYDDLKRPVSLLNLANDQIAALKETNDTRILDDVKESFREVMRPTENLFYIVNWQNTPGTELINAMSITNGSNGKRPSNYLQSVDIAV